MTTLNNQDTIKSLVDFCLKESVGRHTYRIVSLFEEKETVTHYESRPCYGEMRPYHKTHPEEVNDQVGMPGDLHIVFPKGNPIGVAVKLNGMDKYRSDFIEKMITDDTSPYKSAFPEVEFVTNKDGFISGIIQMDTHYDPTLFVNALILRRNFDASPSSVYFKAMKDGASFAEAVFLSKACGSYFSHDSYDFTFESKVSRFFGCNPVNLSINHEMFFDRAVYNRPKNERSFVGLDKEEGMTLGDLRKEILKLPVDKQITTIRNIVSSELEKSHA